ncbi:hypothetical protein CVAR292_00049 [Corynebacterium variabile]|uniref:Uncharacterized protein n=1 Tax=Corynebacterium variabile TaxID=1727 RepID=A0A0X8XUB9_9CORY|nr:hypothetical protein CVAR292_00049 [Corynebacterium variabile]
MTEARSGEFLRTGPLSFDGNYVVCTPGAYRVVTDPVLPLSRQAGSVMIVYGLSVG